MKTPPRSGQRPSPQTVRQAQLQARAQLEERRRREAARQRAAHLSRVLQRVRRAESLRRRAAVELALNFGRLRGPGGAPPARLTATPGGVNGVDLPRVILLLEEAVRESNLIAMGRAKEAMRDAVETYHRSKAP
ncbi:hypothetical protein DM785_10060 [Deinococcus actinosclerus]|nr:hypothetical protein DM785_10060 [Deinococcus actinosclerus]